MEAYGIFRLLSDNFSLDDKRLLNQIINNYTNEFKNELFNCQPVLARDILLSEYNFRERGKLKSCRTYGLTIEDGDIVYLDYGKAYLNEAGYQHFGLVVKVFNAKALIIPMTSNEEAYNNAYDEKYNPHGLTHLMRIGKQMGCFKYSVLFMNDAKFVNTARIINKKSHLDTNGELFKKIQARLIEIIQIGE